MDTRPAASPDIAVDVAIIGGGLVGASLAIALEGSGLAVALVEAAPPRPPATGDGRSLVLARASMNALQALGVLDADAGVALQRIHVSRRGDFGAVRLDAARLGLPPFGNVVPAAQLGAALAGRLDACIGLQRITPAKATAIDVDAEAATVRLDIEGATRTLRARLVVGADGAGSFVRTAAGIGASRHDYGQHAVVTTIEAERPLDHQAFERFTGDGAVALLPLGGRRAGLVLSLPAALAAEAVALDEAAFLALVQGRFGWRLGRFSRLGPRQAWPLQRMLADRLAAPRTVLVGNAAQAVHPIGAQGFNLGLRDALTLAELLAELPTGADCGSRMLLASYAGRRESDRSATTAFSHELVHLMRSDAAPARLLRSAGLHALDRITPLKRRFALRAMGFRGQEPSLVLAP